MNPNPLLVPPAAPAKKKTSGCVIALFVALAVLTVLCLGSGIALWVAARSDTGRQVLDALDKGVKLAEQGMNAPGAAEVRAAGCPRAGIIDMKEAAGVVAGFVDGGLKEAGEEFEGPMVFCQGTIFAKLPDCDELGPVYAKAVSPDRPFVVTVKRRGGGTLCVRRYNPDGTFLEEVKSKK